MSDESPLDVPDQRPTVANGPMPLPLGVPSGSSSKRRRSTVPKLRRKRAADRTTSMSSRPKKQPKQEAETGARRPRMLTMAQVRKKLQEAGVQDLDAVGHCVRSAIARRFIKLDSAADLDAVISSGVCGETFGMPCKNRIDATLRRILYQKDNGADAYYGAGDYPVRCSACNQGFFVTELCTGKPRFCDGKFTNHCADCKSCMGDVRDRHCDKCGKHYFAGSQGQFSCPCRSRKQRGTKFRD